MFPYTAHIEMVCLLSKLSDAKHHVEVELSLDEMELTSAESKATYEEIKAYVQEHAGLNVSKIYIAQTKRKCVLSSVRTIICQRARIPDSRTARRKRKLQLKKP